ncbi:MAG: nucleotidyl transferase AbiEii/AbiGii toxin family protein [Candidatus Dormibacteraeota bacterium]|nr:nucleotidyl transferase AbiEii/AbiGii toxin family protein [Candidatus Dormibacteraeota bacterium]
MIPRAFIVEWSHRVGWPSLDQVEQDLVLSRLIVEIARDPTLGDELILRGGTCLHKLHLPVPLRYSEDLDYVRRSGGGIGEVTRSLTALGERVGMEVGTRVGPFPKVYLRAPFESGSGRMRIKIEVNTRERVPAREPVRTPYQVDSQWFRGEANVLTFYTAELVATKLRALYQRSKGRDLFDLWLALEHLGLAPADIVECFSPYRPDGYTATLAKKNLLAKLKDREFRTDLDPLVPAWPQGYDVDAAADRVLNGVLPLLPRLGGVKP